MASRFILPYADIGEGIKPASGAKLYFYDTGTSTPKDTYSDSAATTPNTNPVVANSSGVFGDIWLTGSYKVVLKDKNEVQIWEADPVGDTSSVSVGNSNGTDRTLQEWINRQAQTYSTVASLVAETNISVGDYVIIENYTATNSSGPMFGKIVASGTGADDGGTYIDLTGSSTQFKQHFVNNQYNVTKFGATGDGATDDYTAINNAKEAAKAVGGKVFFPTVSGQNPTYYNHSGTINMNATGLELEGESTRVNLRYTGTTVGIKGHPYTPFGTYPNGTAAALDPTIANWSTATTYTSGTVLKTAGVYYLVLQNHTSSTVSADITAGNIRQYGYTYENMAIRNLSIITSTGDINLDWTTFTYACIENVEWVNTKANGICRAALGNQGAGPYFNKFDGETFFGGSGRTQDGAVFWEDSSGNLAAGPNANITSNIKRGASLRRLINLVAGTGNLFSNIGGESISDAMIVLNDVPSVDAASTSTSTGQSTLTDTSQTWSTTVGDPNNHTNKSLLLLSGIAGVCRKITANTVDTLTLDKPFPEFVGNTVSYWILDDTAVKNMFVNIRQEGLASDNPDCIRIKAGGRGNEFSHIEAGSLGTGVVFDNESQNPDNKVRQGDFVVQQYYVQNPGPSATINVTPHSVIPRNTTFGGIRSGSKMALVSAEMYSSNFTGGTAVATLTVDHGGNTPSTGDETIVCKLDGTCTDSCYVTGSQVTRDTANHGIHAQLETNANVGAADDFIINITYQVQ